MTAVAFDFRRPPRSGIEDRITRWLTDSGLVAEKLWPRIMPQPTTIQVVGVESAPAASTIANLTEQDTAYRLSSGGSADEDSLLIAPRPLLIALVAAVMGESFTELPKDRELTAVERPVAEHLIKRLLLAIWQEAWPNADGLKLAITAQGIPQKLSPFAANDVAITALMEIDGTFGKVTLRWMMPRSGLVSQLMRSPVAATPNSNGQIGAMIHEFPVELSIVLGTAAVPLSRLANLVEGDVLILEQKVHEPLSVRMANTEKFRVWPGAVGNQQAVRIETVVR